jgi:hypothetical protein
MCGHFLPQIDKRIAHPAQGRIDADAGCVGNFLKAHIAVVAHKQHFFLRRWQLLNELTQLCMTLFAAEYIVGRFF